MPNWLRPLSYELTFMVYARRPITMREISRLVNDVACWSCDGFSSAHIAAAAAAAHATCCCCCRSSGRSFRTRVCAASTASGAYISYVRTCVRTEIFIGY